MIDIMGLNQLLSGWTVMEVRPVEGDASLCEICLQQDGNLRWLHVHAHRLSGWLVDPWRDVRPIRKAETYNSVEEMVLAITDHLLGLPTDEVDLESPLEYMTDGPRRLFGYRCRQTDQVWWVPATVLQQSIYADIFQPENRDRVGALLLQFKPFEVLLQLSGEG